MKRKQLNLTSVFEDTQKKQIMKLSISDKYDNTNKIEELRNAIGYVYSDNHSGTYNSKLLSVSECGNIAYTEEVKSDISNFKPKVGIKSQPSWLVWNAMFS